MNGNATRRRKGNNNSNEGETQDNGSVQLVVSQDITNPSPEPQEIPSIPLDRENQDADNQLRGPQTASVITNEEEHNRDSYRRLSRRFTLRLEKALTDDVYSLLYVSQHWGPAFWFAICVFLTQLCLLVLILVDLVDFSENPPTTSNGVENRIKIPSGNEPYVTAAQFVGVLLVIIFGVVYGDLMKGLDHLFNGYDKEVLLTSPSATWSKWLASGIFQSLAGILMISDLFILMMQSTTVIGMCLNFAALHFCQEIDDVCFTLAMMGLVSTRIQQEAEAVGEMKIASTVKGRTRWMRMTVMGVLVLGLYSGYFSIVWLQSTGHYRCSSLFVQFGDAYGAFYPYYSGRFTSQGNRPWEVLRGRPVYLDDSRRTILRYSRTETAWIFGSYDPDTEDYDLFMKSSQTKGFDVTEVASQTWYNKPLKLVNGREQRGSVLPTDFLSLTCNDCTPDRCKEGTCDNNQCICDEGFAGPSCEDKLPICAWYGLDLRSRKELANTPGASFFFQNEFQPLDQNYLFFDRYIYVPYDLSTEGLYGTGLDTLVQNFVIFSGRRWIVFAAPLEKASDLTVGGLLKILSVSNFTTTGDRAEILLELARLDNYDPVYFSSPVDYGTPSWGMDLTLVTWVGVDGESSAEVSTLETYKPNDNDPIPAHFLCSDCMNDIDVCRGRGKCDWDHTGYCQCLPFYSGYQCEYAYSCQEIGCFNGGTCDPVTGGCRNCFPGATGNLCQFPLEPQIKANPNFCTVPQSESPCRNKQTCNGVDIKCECEPPFYGEFCEQSTMINCSEYYFRSDPCRNGGFCDRSLDHPVCRCRGQYEGDFCEQFKNSSGAEN